MAVKGLPQVKRRLRQIPDRVKDAAEAEIAKQAAKLVGQMRAANPLKGSIFIDWTWGDAPAGGIALARSKGARGVFATVYAAGNAGGRPFPALTWWWEYGTGARVQRSTGRYTGRIPANPYFFPVYRAERRRIRSAIGRAVRRAI